MLSVSNFLISNKHRSSIPFAKVATSIAILAFATNGFGQDVTDPADIHVPPGFKVELVHAVPKDEQGSWIALAIDPKGRFIAADQYEGLFRLTLPKSGSKAKPIVEKLDITLPAVPGVAPEGKEIGAHGLLWAFDSLYVMVNETDGKEGLWRFRDTNGDDQFDKKEFLLPIAHGGGEHGTHSIVLSPDGKSLYFANGNHTKLPTTIDYTKGIRWDEDHLLPRLWDPRGHANGIYAPGGYVGKCDPDGGSVEIFAQGFRNHFDMAFDQNGELFAFDSDMEWSQGNPWYVPTRINHVTSGAEFGWRGGAGRWPAYYADSLPSTVDIGPGSPTGVTMGTGAKFPAKYQRAFFALDWTYGTLYAIHHTPAGSSFHAEREEFVSGKPLPLTDAIINPNDGAMYFAIGGRRTQSALYKVTYTGREKTTLVGPLEPTPEAKLRRQLEAFHTPLAGPEAVAIAWPHLASNDRFLRFAARVAIEHQPISNWIERASDETDPQAIVEAMIALARVGEKHFQSDIFEKLESIDFASQSTSIRLSILRAWQLAFTRMGDPGIDTREHLLEGLDPFFPQDDSMVNRELAALLVYLDSPTIVAKAVPLLEVDEPMTETAEQLGGNALIERNDGYGDVVRRINENRPDRQQIAYAYALREATAGWTPELRGKYFTWFSTKPQWRGGASFPGYMKNIRADALAKIEDPVEAEAMAKLTEPVPYAYVSGAIAPKGPGQAYTVDDAVALFSEGLTNRDFQRGEAMFASSACIACHMFNGEGSGIGPDLTGAGNRYNVHDLLENIIEPSKVLSDQYQFYKYNLDNGDTIIGRAVNDAPNGYQLMTSALAPDILTWVWKNNVVSIEPYQTSMMPTGLVNALNPEELKDLVAYILSGGDPAGPMFSQ